MLQQRVVEYMVKRVLLGCRGLPWYRYGAEVEGRPDPRGLPGHRSYAVGRFWVTKIKANIEPGQKTKFRVLKHLRSDEAKAAEELKSRKRYASRMPLTRALPACDDGLIEDPDPADCFS